MIARSDGHRAFAVCVCACVVALTFGVSAQMNVESTKPNAARLESASHPRAPPQH